ncbi:head completion/stabilization protein [Escherichia coli]|nr:head completion/stabilization protein [Escherichia coli]
MKFVAPEQAPEQAEIIRNTPFWPNVDLSEFRSVMRTDGTVTQPRLKQVALSAISEVNAELYEFRRRQQMLGYASLAEVPAEQLDGKSERIQHYFNAVYCWARAMLNERYQDYDATASGVKRGEELAEASGDLWRDARWAISRVSGLLGALLSPIGLVVTALAGVALVVWKYWQPITAFLGGVVEGFKAAAGPISAAFEPLKPVFQWIGDKVQALWGWFTDLLTPVKSTSAELQSAAAMGRRFGEALAEGLNMVMHPLDSLKSGVSWLLEKLGIVSKEAAKAKLPESVTRQQPATVNADGKVMMPSGDFPSWGYGFAGMYDSGGYIPRGQFGIVGENGPEIVNGPANVTSRRNTAALAAVVAGMMGVAAAPAELPPLHPLALPAKGGEAMVSRAATVPPIYRIEAPTQIIIQTQLGQSAQDIAREVARQLDERERRLKAKARSNYSDQGGYDA